jgi:hypothetical protein
MIRTYAALFCFCVGAATVGCKSEEKSRAEKAEIHIQLSKEEGEAAKAQLAEAERQLAASAEKLGKEGAALGAQGAALGAQGAALGMKAAATGIQAATAAMNQMAASMGQAGGQAAPLVDFRALKALLPESVAGLKRVSATGEKSTALGMGASQAEAKYQGAGGARLTIKIIDPAGLGVMAFAGLGLAGIEVDKETEHGYERTTTVGGHKAFEKYDSQSRRGRLNLLVANRFVLEIEGDEVPMDAVKEAAGKIDVAKLQGLAAEAAAAAGAAKK